jgi:glyoxylase-like metal-dependent hydrolase (beta-lactamase superfamily II)
MALGGYSQGLHEIGDGLFAYLQPDGGWGLSNAGLVTGAGSSMLIDTLFDLRGARALLDALAKITAEAPIGAAVNTHGNGDHCFGNQLLPAGIPIHATRAAEAEIRAAPPAVVASLEQASDSPAWQAFWARTFGRFDFADVELRAPTELFDGRVELSVAGRALELIEVGPAHTAGDAILNVPDAGVVFTGDILFADATPVMWHGPVSNWLTACDLIAALNPSLLIPGHGPVSDLSALQATRNYLEYIRAEARIRFDAGLDAVAAADDIDLRDFDGWGEPERIVVNVEALYREFDPARSAPPPPVLFVAMAEWSARHS